ncbi:MAG: class I SAM-dependent methyltransferase [Deltaproteobacteria bacterium]|jgi:SAM-dependent methyltransferase|nr:class I SAM-dependent methyltransferase [Deltaproteobacteria bacterium]
MINSRYLSPNDVYYHADGRELRALIPEGPNVVMDLGCASGRLGRNLLETGKAGRIVGIEIFEPAAKEAMKRYDTVYVGDIENLELDYDRYFDVVVCGDILEHLREPDRILGKIRRWLKDQGLLVCCVPNVRYWRIIKDLALRGEWRYANCGILDHTHLRFFTARSFKRMLHDNSFRVVHEGFLYSPKAMVYDRITLGLFHEFFGYQILMSARKC